jgi:hypothetical protein
LAVYSSAIGGALAGVLVGGLVVETDRCPGEPCRTAGVQGPADRHANVQQDIVAGIAHPGYRTGIGHHAGDLDVGGNDEGAVGAEVRDHACDRHRRDAWRESIHH